jgi:dTDP-4-dehydrorhamnose reductase
MLKEYHLFDQWTAARSPLRLDKVSFRRPPLALWGGVECTVNRVGDEYFDQLERSGHAARISDLDLFAELGVAAMRYPVLWERTALHGLGKADWSWPDERLGRLRQLGIKPIVGLVHHGGGPRHTSLVEPSFAEGLARFARAVAERYPWVESYTPVNEPLTTARFSGQYGHWYPHSRDGLSFARALLNQCRAVVLAMRAIRRVNPAAQLVQTEDLGKTYSTEVLDYQAEFENERRWITFDLLCGRVDRHHPMWHHLRWLGAPADEIEWFLDNPCPPDVMGIDHYLTSERFLDHNVERYPARLHGGNGQHAYVDLEAVRVCVAEIGGPYALLREAWDRYHLPLAVTEAHLNCTREEQMRWLLEVWSAARTLRQEDVDIRAVTAWALLGAYDWNSLLTRRDDHYEPGVFDARAPQPRPTALATMLRELARNGEYDHPALSALGWWRRPVRLLYAPVHHDARGQAAGTTRLRVRRKRARPLAIMGATGTLGTAFARLCEHRGLPCRLLSRGEMDIADEYSVNAVLSDIKPWAVVNAAGYVRVDDAEREAEACRRENAVGPSVLATACARHEAALLTFSSDLVFDGSRKAPYVESDAAAPLSSYGRSKAEAEARVLELLPSALVVRTSAFFGPWDDHNFVTRALCALAAGRRFVAANDAVVSPTYVPDLVHAALDLLIDGEYGLWHLANGGAVTWAEFARQAAELAGLDAAGVEERPTHELGFVAPRPRYSVLASERATLLPTLDKALGYYFHDCKVSWN